MKIGDNMLCITTRYNSNTFNLVHRAGKMYKITNLYSGTIILENEDDLTYRYWYDLNRAMDTTNRSGYLFEDYFMTIRESRKLKLEKLNRL